VYAEACGTIRSPTVSRARWHGSAGRGAGSACRVEGIPVPCIQVVARAAERPVVDEYPVRRALPPWPETDPESLFGHRSAEGADPGWVKRRHARADGHEVHKSGGGAQRQRAPASRQRALGNLRTVGAVYEIVVVGVRSASCGKAPALCQQRRRGPARTGGVHDLPHPVIEAHLKRLYAAIGSCDPKEAFVWRAPHRIVAPRNCRSLGMCQIHRRAVRNSRHLQRP